jgi:hypothetical protein
MPASPIKKRIAPSVPLTLELTDDGGATFVRNFRLSFDFNAFARIEEKTGLRMLGIAVWTQLSAKVLGAMLWAAVLAHHEEYDTIDGQGQPTEDGLQVIRSYIDLSNADKIAEALWQAYLLNLPKDKAEMLRKARAEEEAKSKLPNAAAPAETPAQTLSPGSSSGPSPDTTSALTMTNSAD